MGRVCSRYCWYQLRPWTGKYSVSWTRPAGSKTLTATLNDVGNRDEFRATRYLTLKNNKIPVEEKQQGIDKLGKLCSERKTCWQKWFTTLSLSVYQADECALHGTYVRATGIELYRNDFATTTQLQVACMQWIPKTYLTFNL